MKTYTYFKEAVKQRNRILHPTVKTISFKIYEVIPTKDGKGTKRSKGLITIVAKRADLDAAFRMADDLIIVFEDGTMVDCLRKRYIQNKHFWG